MKSNLIYIFPIVLVLIVGNFLFYLKKSNDKKLDNLQIQLSEQISKNSEKYNIIRSGMNFDQKRRNHIRHVEKIISYSNSLLSLDICNSYATMIVDVADRYQRYDYLFFTAMIKHESTSFIQKDSIKIIASFNKDAISPVGAVGLGQLMYPTALDIANWMGWNIYDEKDLFIPEVNLKMAGFYLNKMADAAFICPPTIDKSLNRMIASKHNLELALAGYNGGYLQQIRYKYYLIDKYKYSKLTDSQIEQRNKLAKETENYVEKITIEYNRFLGELEIVETIRLDN